MCKLGFAQLFLSPSALFIDYLYIIFTKILNDSLQRVARIKDVNKKYHYLGDETMKMKTVLSMAALGLFSLGLVACGGNGSSSSGQTIEVVSREDGSGTRGAFTELTGILSKENGKEVDNTSKAAVIQNNTEVVISTVSGNTNAVGYISLGSLNDKVKAVKLDGVEASEENVLSGEYKLQRPFNVVWSGKGSEIVTDFLSYINSKEGQAIVKENHYIQATDAKASYEAKSVSGKLSIVGSTSVAPLIEKLAESYCKLNPDVTIDMTANGSSAGITAAKEGTADIGMVSRELTDDEQAGLTHQVIALDGIVVITNKDNQVDSLTMDQISSIFTGKTTTWSDVK